MLRIHGTFSPLPICLHGPVLRKIFFLRLDWDVIFCIVFTFLFIFREIFTPSK